MDGIALLCCYERVPAAIAGIPVAHMLSFLQYIRSCATTIGISSYESFEALAEGLETFLPQIGARRGYRALLNQDNVELRCCNRTVWMHGVRFCSGMPGVVPH